VFGILDDKERLTRGQSTQNVALSNVVEIIDRKLKEQRNEKEKSEAIKTDFRTSNE
jgi:hypothetical protein